MKTYFRLSLIMLFILVFVSTSGQNNRFHTAGIYNSNLAKYLLPEIKGSDTLEIISFIEKPSFDPESAFRIIRSHDQFTLEGRFCNKNYWMTIFPYFEKNEKIPSPEVSFYTINISNEFADQLSSEFYRAVNIRENRFNDAVDSVSYVLRYKSAGLVFHKTIENPRKGDPVFKLCETSSELTKDIKNQKIDESKYLNLIKRVTISDIYRSNLAKYLLPAIKGPDTTEIVSYTERRSFESESAFRIVRSHDQYTLEGRFCRKNYWYEIFPYLKKNETVPPPEISFYSINISNEFANKLISSFHEEVNKPVKTEKIYEMVNGIVYRINKEKVDGVLYVFSDKSSGAISSKTFHSPSKDEPGYNLCMTASKLVKDLRNQTFDELKYMNVEWH